MLEYISVMLHKNFLTCASKTAKFLYNLTKNLAAQSAHLNCAVLPKNFFGVDEKFGSVFVAILVGLCYYIVKQRQRRNSHGIA